MNRAVEPEIMDDGEMATDLGGAGAIMQINASEINQQIATAKRYPRSIKEFVREATEMVSMSREVAEECMYSLKRKEADGGVKVIEGPSARMAEIVASAWGNCRAGARVIDEDDRFVTAQGAFIDLQRNVAITYEVRRRITGRNGRKYGDDMVGVTANAACSIALRNAVFKGVPKAFWQQIYRTARQTAIGDAKTLGQRRGDMIAAFAKMGVEKEKVFAYIDVKGIEDVTLDHLALMIGVFNSIRDGETTIEQAFDSQQPASGSKVGDSDLADKLKKKSEGEKPEGDAQPAGAANNDVQPAASDETILKYEAKIEEADGTLMFDRLSDDLLADKTLSPAQRDGLMATLNKKRKPKK